MAVVNPTRLPVDTPLVGLYTLNEEDEDSGSGFAGTMVIVLSWVLVVLTLPFSLFFCFKVVQQYEKAIIFRSGRLKSGDTDGVFFILPCWGRKSFQHCLNNPWSSGTKGSRIIGAFLERLVAPIFSIVIVKWHLELKFGKSCFAGIESYTKIDTRSSVFNVPAQEVLTKDSVTVAVDAVLYYRVSNAAAAITNVKNAHASTKLLAQTALRRALGTKNLHDLLADRDAISSAMAANLDEATNPWGIKVERVEITDVRLPHQLQRAMAVEGEAAREAKAKVIAAEGEHKASKALKEAAETLSESAAAIQLRYLQTLTTVAAENNKTIIFPLPVHILTQLREKWERNILRAKNLKLKNLAAEDLDFDLDEEEDGLD